MEWTKDELSAGVLEEVNDHNQTFSIDENGSSCETSTSCIIVPEDDPIAEQSMGEGFDDVAKRDPDTTYANVKSIPDSLVKTALLLQLAQVFLQCSRELPSEDSSSRAISVVHDFLTLAPDDYPTRGLMRRALANRILTHMRLFPTSSAIDEYMHILQDTLPLIPDDHPDKWNLLDSFGIRMEERFSRLGDVSDIHMAVALQGIALQLAPDGHEDKARISNNLGISCLSRFEHFGTLTDIDKAVSAHTDAVRLTPDSDADKPRRLTNLGNCYRQRFERLGVLADLDMAISVQQDAVRLVSDSYEEKADFLNNLGSSYQARFLRLGDLSDVDLAISIHREAVRSTPDGHTANPNCFNSLGNSLLARYERLAERGDIDQAILAHESAVRLLSDGHVHKPSHLNNLGGSYRTRFLDHADPGDIRRAIFVCEEAMRLTPDVHAEKCMRLFNLSASFLCRYINDRDDQTALELACKHFTSAAHATGHPSQQFKAASQWALCARTLSHPSLLEAYTVAFNLLPRLAWLGVQMASRQFQLAIAGNVIRDGVATAIESGRLDLAVEWLEQGRSVIWGQLLQLRTPVHDLAAMHPEISKRVQELGQALEHGSTAALPLPNRVDSDCGMSFEQEAQQHRRLTEEWETLVKEVRGHPGFETFLMPKTLQQLTAGVRCGPIVVLNASDYGCAALVISPHMQKVVHVPLPDCSIEDLEKLRNLLDQLLFADGRVPMERAVRRPAAESQDYNARFEIVLLQLWSRVVNPILHTMGFTVPPSDAELMRIWWCPTGPFAFLPIHAAGDYRVATPGLKLTDFAISSYTPTIAALATPPPDGSPPPFRVLAVAQSAATGPAHIPGTVEEINRIRECAGSVPVLPLLESDATVESVVRGMQDASWAHFACHGVQNVTNPMESGLVLHGGMRLSLSEIIKLSLPHAELAFLSACQTAQGDKQLSEEAVHLAAGMLLAGYRAVIATMWSISDREAPQVAEDVYAHLLSGRKGKQPDGTQAARALHDAVRGLRQRLGDRKGYATWVPYIHIGL